MAQLAQKLRHEFQKALARKIVPFEAILRGEKNAEEIGDMDQLIEKGDHPTHAVYKLVINLMAVFIEEVAELPFLYRAYNFLVKAEDLYVPGYPPMSPITLSHYATWSACDVRFGAEKETLCECFLAIAELLELDSVRLEATQQLSQSRLGIYETGRHAGDTFQLRELVTGKELEAIIPTQFKGSPGSLILARLVPPLAGIPGPHICLTTPYVLVSSSSESWTTYFQRQDIVQGTIGVEERLHRHMKYGKDDWYWSEFIFYGYVNYRTDAIMLTGFPDLPETQPYHKRFDRSTLHHSISV